MRLYREYGDERESNELDVDLFLRVCILSTRINERVKP